MVPSHYDEKKAPMVSSRRTLCSTGNAFYPGQQFIWVAGRTQSASAEAALTFVNNLCRSESPALAYATVYPLTTLLRILIAQLMALLLCG